MKPKLIAYSLVCCVSLMSMTAGVAQAEPNRPCAADRKKLCGNVAPGEGRIIKCMKENEAKLSPECQKLRANQKPGQRSALMPACAAEKKSFCKGMTPEKTRACLLSNQANASAKCKEALLAPTRK